MLVQKGNNLWVDGKETSPHNHTQTYTREKENGGFLLFNRIPKENEQKGFLRLFCLHAPKLGFFFLRFILLFTEGLNRQNLRACPGSASCRDNNVNYHHRYQT